MYPVSILTALAAFILVLCAAQGVRMVSYDAARSLSMEENVASQEKEVSLLNSSTGLAFVLVACCREPTVLDGGHDWKVD